MDRWRHHCCCSDCGLYPCLRVPLRKNALTDQELISAEVQGQPWAATAEVEEGHCQRLALWQSLNRAGGSLFGGHGSCTETKEREFVSIGFPESYAMVTVVLGKNRLNTY